MPPQMNMMMQRPQMAASAVAAATAPQQQQQPELDADSVNWDDLPACLVQLGEGNGYKCKTCGKSLNSKMQVVQVSKGSFTTFNFISLKYFY